MCDRCCVLGDFKMVSFFNIATKQHGFFIKLTKILVDMGVKWHDFLTKLTEISIDMGVNYHVYYD